MAPHVADLSQKALRKTASYFHLQPVIVRVAAVDQQVGVGADQSRVHLKQVDRVSGSGQAVHIGRGLRNRGGQLTGRALNQPVGGGLVVCRVEAVLNNRDRLLSGQPLVSEVVAGGAAIGAGARGRTTGNRQV